MDHDPQADSHPAVFLDEAPSVMISFLSATSHSLYRDTDHIDHAPVNANKRAIALLIYCDHALRELSVIPASQDPKHSTLSSELLASILPLATTSDVSQSKVDVAGAARAAMTSTLRVMPATDFVDAVLSMLSSEDLVVSSALMTQTSVFTVILSDSNWCSRASGRTFDRCDCRRPSQHDCDNCQNCGIRPEAIIFRSKTFSTPPSLQCAGSRRSYCVQWRGEFLEQYNSFDPPNCTTAYRCYGCASCFVAPLVCDSASSCVRY